MTFSGNSAHYSTDKLKKISPKFNHLRLVEFCDNETVTVYHYGRISMEEIEEFKTIGSILTEPLVLHGYNYTDNRPAVAVITDGKVYFSDTTSEVVSTHPAIVDGLRKLPFYKVHWLSHPKHRSQVQAGIPKLVTIIEPNCEFDTEDE